MSPMSWHLDSGERNETFVREKGETTARRNGNRIILREVQNTAEAHGFLTKLQFESDQEQCATDFEIFRRKRKQRQQQWQQMLTETTMLKTP